MKTLAGVGLADVQAVYAGPEGDLWRLIMGEQIHIGGLESTLDLARRADIKAGWAGVDLCCCLGAGMRSLVRFRGVTKMVGVDATPRVLALGREMCQAEGLEGRIEFRQADACASGLPDGAADFVWGEDAWCYVADKAKLVAEAVRMVRPGGVVAFTDWVEGPAVMTDAEAARLLKFMKFPSLQDMAGYAELLRQNGCTVLAAEDTGRFPRYMDLYLSMLNMQLTYDALKIIGFDQGVMQGLAGEMAFAQELAHKKKLVQGLFVARKG